MALPLGALLLVSVVGAAVFAGLDPRKKKKNGVASPENGGESPAYDVAPCAHVIDISDDGTLAALDGGQWQDAEALDNFWDWAVEFQRPQVTFLMCQPDPQTLQVIDQLCKQRPDADFYGLYSHRLAGVPAQELGQVCASANALAVLTVTTPVSDSAARYYHWGDVQGLAVRPGQNLADVIATVVAALDGADMPGMDTVEVA